MENSARTVLLLLVLAVSLYAKGPRVVSVTVEPRWPWNGLVDVVCKTEWYGAKPQEEHLFYVTRLKGYDRLRNQSVDMRTLSLDGGRTFANLADGMVVSAQRGDGTMTFTWNAGADYPSFNTSDFIVSVNVKVQNTYLVVDLLTGQVRYTNVPPDLSDDTCRTTELWLSYVSADVLNMGATMVAWKNRDFADVFIMGSLENDLGRGDSETQHEVTLTSGFWMGVFEVTQKQWSLLRGSNPSYFQGDTCPMEFVSYNHIRGRDKGAGWPEGGHAVDDDSFLGRLRALTGLEFDLPTEAQWEYACRAGTTTALNSGKNLTATTDKCPNLAELGRYLYNCDDGRGGYQRHTKVGSYLPNGWGLYDMHGNVLEWCLDWYDSYGTEPVTDPKGPASGSKRVLRGGAWNGDGRYCRSAYRFNGAPSTQYYSFGFRVSLAP